LIKKIDNLLNSQNSLSQVDVSIIIPCKNEVNNLKPTVDSIIKSKNTLNFEVIVVDDGSTDKSTDFLNLNSNRNIYKGVKLIKTDKLGVAGARNAGAKIAKGNYLFFCDAHIKVPDRWLDKLVSTLKNDNAHIVAPCIADMNNIYAVGYGQSLDKNFRSTWLTSKPKGAAEIPFACGCTSGITKEAFEKIGGFDHLFQVYGSEDFEICFKAWLYGCRVVVNPDVKVQHLFRPSHPYEVTTSNVIFNILCLGYSHFGKERLTKTISMMKNEYAFSSAAADIKAQSELILKQREKYFRERMHDDNFYFEKFKIPF
jgi:glycosyltransferase involved in cell wall biosynthesis